MDLSARALSSSSLKLFPRMNDGSLHTCQAHACPGVHAIADVDTSSWD